MAERLRSACCWEGGPAPAVDLALKDTTSPENLVVRTPVAAFPEHRDTILQLKEVEPLLIKMLALVSPVMGFTFDQAVAYAIFCVSRGLDGYRPSTRIEFTGRSAAFQSVAGVVSELTTTTAGSETRARPVILELDGITKMDLARFAGYRTDNANPSSAMQSAMTALSHTLQQLHSIPGCFVYSTASSLWLPLQPLVQATTSMSVKRVLMHPLSAGDVAESIMLTRDPDGGPYMLEHLRVSPEVLEYFVSRVQSLTGGVGSAVEALTRDRHRSSYYGAPLLRTERDVDASLEWCMPSIAGNAGVPASFKWEGGKRAADAGQAPSALKDRGVQDGLLHIFARMLLLDAAFEPEYHMPTGTPKKLYLADAAVAFGMTYGPAPAPATAAVTDERDSAAAAAAAGVVAVATPSSSCTHLRLIAGEFFCRSLLNGLSSESRPATRASAQLLAAVRSFGGSGGTMRGRLFEMLCAEALCSKALLHPKQALGVLLPHLNSSMRRADTVGVQNQSWTERHLGPLPVVALPTVAAAGQLARPLDDEAKAGLLQSRQRWTGAAAIHSDDLPWLLSEWLPQGNLGVPANAGSCSQDLFLRLSGGVVGFATKAAAASAGTDWSDLRDELRKAPALPAHVPYTLVVWSLHLAPQLQAALGRSSSAVCGTGRRRYHPDPAGKVGTVVKVISDGDSTAGCDFEVGAGAELVIANPRAPSGAGLSEVLGDRVLGQLLSMGAPGTAHLAGAGAASGWERSIDHLIDITTSPDGMVQDCTDIMKRTLKLHF